MLRKISYVMLTVVIMSLSDIGIDVRILYGAEPDYDKQQRMTEMLKSRDVPIQFYGQVIDQNKQPVVNADVFINVEYSGGIKELTVKTNSQGLFELKNETGNFLFVDKIIKKGYEFSYKNNTSGFRYWAHFEKDRHKPNKNRPVIFTMRKKEPPTLVVPGNFSRGLDPKGTEYELDLLERVIIEAGKLGKYSKKEHADLRIKATLSKDGSSYAVTFTTPDKKSGILVRDDLLYVAPAEGYAPRQTITVSIPEKVEKHLYIKGRQGGLYSRLDMTISASEEKKIGINIKSWSNPTGSRNVDFDENLYGQELDRVMEERKRRNIEREERKLKYQQEKKQ